MPAPARSWQSAVPDWVAAILRAREAAGLWRELQPRQADEKLLDLAGNDYLGLARHPDVLRGARDAVAVWGAGSTGSRLVTGTTALHAELESRLAEFCAADAALVFSSGYLANLGVIAALSGPGTLVVSDSGNHASIVDACRLSRARVAVVPHLDADAVSAALAARTEPRALVVTDAVFSVDGDAANLAELHTVARTQGALLVVDEAHSLGVTGEGGRGAVFAAGLAGEPDVIRTVTLSKALGSQGGAVLAGREIIALLVNTSRPFIFDTALAPACVGGALSALGVLAAEPERALRTRRVAVRLATAAAAGGLETARPAAAVVPVFLGDPDRAVAARDRMAEQGIRVGCFRPPSVPAGRSCLRLTARATLSDDDLAHFAEALAVALTSSGPSGNQDPRLKS